MAFLLFIVVIYYTFHAIRPSNYFDVTSGSLWIFSLCRLWVHCSALYVITISACILLYHV